MVLNHIFLDLDDVLADFVGGVAESFDVPYESINAWDMSHALGCSKEEVRAWISSRSQKWWNRRPPHPWHKDLIAFCRSLAPTTVATARYGNAAAAVPSWLKQHVGDDVDWAILDHKYLLAQTGRVLIDDSEKKVEAFRQAGGHGIVFPRPWNSQRKHWRSAYAHVCRELASLVSPDDWNLKIRVPGMDQRCTAEAGSISVDMQCDVHEWRGAADRGARYIPGPRSLSIEVHGVGEMTCS